MSCFKLKRGLISAAAAAATAGSCLRRPQISISQIRGCSKLSGGGDSSLRRISSPWLMLPPSFEKGGGGGGSMSYNFYSLAEKKVISLKKKSESESESADDDALCVGSSHGWLALYNHRGDGSLFLSNPITGESIKLPPLDTLKREWEKRDRKREVECFVKKLILSSPPHQQDCLALLTAFFPGQLAICGPGQCTTWDTDIECSQWDPDVDFEFNPEGYFEFQDIVNSKRCERFFGLYESRDPDADEDEDEYEDVLDLVVWSAFGNDPFTLEDEWRVPLEEFGLSYSYTNEWRDIKKRSTSHLVLVEHTDQLLFVRRHQIKGSTIAFDVHDIDWSGSECRYMEGSLDGLVLFVGINHSLALPAAEFPELKPDSIYFTEAATFASPSLCPDHTYDIGIFDYKERTISPCYYPGDQATRKEKIYPSPFWFTPSPH